MNRYKKLVNNSVLFAVGNFGSKIINLVMVPLYTFVLNPREYGTVDLLTTTISLLLPVLSVSIGEAVIRFVLKPGLNKVEINKILTNALIVNFFTSVLFSLLYPFFSYFNLFGKLLKFFFIQLILSQFQLTISQFSRGAGFIKEYAINGIIMTLATASFNILFLVHYSMGLNGYMMSLILANLISVSYLFIVTKCHRRIRVRDLDLKLVKEMTVYSIPLIPNMIMWWVINSSTRYFILFFINPAANGVYAVANKIPSILSMFTSIFQQAWQISAFEEFKANDKGNFFSKIFQVYYQFLFIGSSLIMVLIKPILPSIISNSYLNSLKIIPLLLLAVIYQSFSSFIGTNYTATMKTKGVFTSSIIGAVISLAFNLLLIPKFGLSGAGVGTCISFYCMFLIRFIDTKKVLNMKIDFKLFYINNAVVLLQIIVILLGIGGSWLFFIELILFLSLFIFNTYTERESLKTFFKTKK